MSEAGHSLSSVFGLDNSKLPDLRIAEVATCVRKLQQSLPDGIPAGYWPAVMTQVGAKVREALDIPLESILAGAWQRHKQFQKYCDSERYPPDVTSVVPLADHTISSTLEPYVEVFADDVSIGRIALNVQLKVALEGATLSIRDGKFRSLGLVRGKVGGKLSCGDVVLLDLSSRQYELPANISFGDGIPIATGQPRAEAPLAKA
jgi:hypothetical protein